MGGMRRRIIAAGTAAAVSAGTARLLAAAPSSSPARPHPAEPSSSLDALGPLQRRNFRGETVSLGLGVGAAVGACAAALTLPRGLRGAALIAAGAAAASGAYDDFVAPAREHTGDKGLAGHWAAARRGRPTGGAVKLPMIGVAAVAAARLMGLRGADALIGATAIAGAANLANLLDLRPGRAAKAASAAGLALLGGPGGSAAAAAIGAACAGLPADLGERGMLGDVGANPLGALLGVRIAALPRGPRLLAAAAVVALNVASERISFSAVIERTPWLRAADRWGRTR